MMLLFFACVSQERFFTEYDISAQVTNPSSGSTHHATLLHEWVGEGDLRYPMFPLDETSFSGERLESWLVLVEQNQGEGLALFIWEDLDADGVHCALDGSEERSGLILLNSEELVLNGELELSNTCMGFERLYGLISN